MSLLRRMLILSDQGPIFMMSFKLNYSFTPDTVTLGVRTSTYEFGEWGGHIHLVHIYRIVREGVSDKMW